MRKQAEQLVVGRVYADLEEGENTSFLRLEKYDSVGDPIFSHVGGKKYSFPNDDGLYEFFGSSKWYELTPEEDALYNKPSNLTPSEPTFTLSDIQRVIERIEREVKDLDTFNDRDFNHINYGLNVAIEIMREELKLK